MEAKPASDVLAGGLIEPGVQHQEGTPESVSGTRAHGHEYDPVAFHATRDFDAGGDCFGDSPRMRYPGHMNLEERDSEADIPAG